jgi:hypothetical protein
MNVMAATPNTLYGTLDGLKTQFYRQSLPWSSMWYWEQVGDKFVFLNKCVIVDDCTFDHRVPFNEFKRLFINKELGGVVPSDLEMKQLDPLMRLEYNDNYEFYITT